MSRFPEVHQHLLTKARPEREQNKRAAIREKWWLFAEPRKMMRRVLSGLSRFAVTVQTSKHRFFVFIPTAVLPDDKLIAIALENAAALGVLSSRAHCVWALASGGRLGVGNDPVYNKSTCFDAFPFPAYDEAQKEKIRQLGEALDGHRKRQQALHSKLTLTNMYNVLAKLRSGEALTAKERIIHEQGLCSVLKQIHDDLDDAVFDAYGWLPTLTDEEILERLVALNHERAAEEKNGLIRWLRPDFQNPSGAGLQKKAVELLPAPDKDNSDEVGLPTSKVPSTGKKQPWPTSVPAQVQAVRTLLPTLPLPITIQAVASRFTRARKERIGEILETLVLLGHARRVDGGFGG